MAARLYAVLASALLGAVLLGCGSGETRPQPEVVPISGQVIQKGKPVSGIVLTFTPRGEGGYAASAKTDDQGRYVLQTTYGEELLKGIAPGEYQVTFVELKGPSGSGMTLADIGDPEKGAFVPTGGGIPRVTTVELRQATDSLDFDLDKLGSPKIPKGMRRKFPGQ